MLFSILSLLFLTTPPAPDTLVVCPTEFRASLAPWEAYRRSQGHEILAVDVPRDAAQLQATIRDIAAAGTLKYVLLIGDVPSIEGKGLSASSTITVPTAYISAQVNKRWGSEPTIATDAPFADLDTDGMPDLALGRIPADSPAELSAVVQKILCYEQGTDHGNWERRLNIVAGVGGFGAVADMLVEAAGRQVIQATVPQGYLVSQTIASPTSRHCPPPGQFNAHVRKQFNAGSLAWIYLGHGLPTELDHVRSLHGEEGILSVHDVPELHCGANSPLAVLIACYSGAFDAHRDCLAERLALDPHGPVAVIAATRVTMPYGNTVLGYELLRASFSERTAELGEVLRIAKKQALQTPAAEEMMRSSLDALAKSVSPPPVDLATERVEHVAMYNLLGDPLLRWRRPIELDVFAPTEIIVGDPLAVEIRSEISGNCLLELLSAGDLSSEPIVKESTKINSGRSQFTISVTPGTPGAYTLRAFVAGREASAVGSTPIQIRRDAPRLSKAAKGISTVQ